VESTFTVGTTHRTGLRPWLGLAVLALPTFLLAIDTTVLYLAVPQLTADLAPSGTQLLWIIDIYSFMIAGLLITMGSLGDRVGRRRVLIAGAVLFGLASVLAAYSTNPAMLILARALLGVAGATLMPSTLALISDLFHDPRRRRLAIGIWAACFSAGVLAGPLIGGLLLNYFWWGSVFLMAVPVMVLLVAAAPILLPESRDAEAGRLDALNVLLSLSAMLLIIYGLKSMAERGPGLVAVGTVAVGLALGAAFIRRQRRQADPMVDVQLFRRRSFSAAIFALLIGLAAMGGVYLYLTQYLQLVVGLTPLEAGLWLLPSAAAMVISSVSAPVLTRWISPGILVGSAMGVSALGYLSLLLADGNGSLAVIVIALTVIYLGIGPLMALGTDLVVGGAPANRAGSAGALSETSMELGLAAGVAVLGSIGTAVYRAELSGPALADVPAQATGSARDTLAGALDAAAGLPAGQGELLAGAAREAFTAALNLAGGISAALMAVAAVLTVLWARDRAD
jgi:MFS transporter, DHA2 family, multidrug resistance protein